MTTHMIRDDSEDSISSALFALLNDQFHAPSSSPIGLFHHGDVLESRPLPVLSAAMAAELRIVADSCTGRAAFGEALRRTADRIQAGEALLECDFLWGLALPMRFDDGPRQRVRLIAAGGDGTLHWCTVTGGLPLAHARLTGAATMRAADPVVAGLASVLEVAVHAPDRAYLAATAALIADLRDGDRRGDGHAVVGIWQQGGEVEARTMLEATGVVERHLQTAHGVEEGLERAAAELATAPGQPVLRRLVGTGLLTVDATGPVPMIVANAVVGTRLSAIAWPFDAPEPVKEIYPWHDLGRKHRRFITALRSTTAALRTSAS